MKAVIMAGGRGTRIQSIASDIPKPMIPVLGKPVLQYQIENLRRCGFEDIILVTGYLSDPITGYFGDGSGFGVNISYFNEERPMGTAGALHYLRDSLKEDFLLLMGDLMLSVDFERFMKAHRESKAAVTLFVHPNSHPFDSDIIVTDEVGRLEDFTEDKCSEKISSVKGRPQARPVTGVIGKKEPRGEGFYYHNQVNSGIYAFSGEIPELVPEPLEKIDLDRDVIRPLIGKGRVYAYSSSEYVKDMGTPERYAEVTEAVETGLAEHRNLAHRQKCIFLDRDGTVNVEKGFLNNADGMELLPGAAEALRRVNSSEYLTVIITNQPVIARGECSFEGLDEIMKKFDTLLGREGAYVDGVFYCPHHPDSGFKNEVRQLKFRCRCRKGRPGMILDAAERFNIDLENSWMIGDKTSDVGCGFNAGTHTILLRTGAAGSDGRFELQPDHICADLEEAVALILKGREN